MAEPAGGPPTFGNSRYFAPGSFPFSKISLSNSPRLLGRYSAGAGPAQEISLAVPFTLDSGVFSAQAAAQFNVLGRKTAGAGAYEDCTRAELFLARTDANNNFTASQTIQAATGTASNFTLNGDQNAAAVTMTRAQTGTNGPSFTMRSAGGSIAAPTVVSTNQNIFNLVGAGHTGAAFVNVSQLVVRVIEAAPGAAAMGTDFKLRLTPIGSATITDCLTSTIASPLQVLGGNVVIDGNRLLKRRAFTFATLPAAAASQDGFAVITDGAAAPVWNAAAAGGGATRTPVRSDGAAWING